MKILSLCLAALIFATTSWAVSWQQGKVTRTAWHDEGGYQVEIDHIRYVFMRDAKILHQGAWYDMPDRLHLIRIGTSVRLQKQGFRIYALEIIRGY